MSSKNINTELKILKAAKKVFIIKGFEGSRMQEIADTAGINKSLLHYYFRTKDNLFDAVFKDVFFSMIPRIAKMFESDMSIFNKIEIFVNDYIDMIVQNPYLPNFIFHETNRNPNRVIFLLRDAWINPLLIIDIFDEEIKKGNIKPIDPKQLILNIISMCVFPFVAKPVMQSLFFNNNEDEYKIFIEERKKEVTDFIINAISIK
ncbi:MAG: TetR/AcrR family transcriptional regulator [Bacteroidales bacterium]|nr:TetR/AcrR family transcriptional regulator [Bacteroidales bacterium]